MCTKLFGHDHNFEYHCLKGFILHFQVSISSKHLPYKTKWKNSIKSMCYKNIQDNVHEFKHYPGFWSFGQRCQKRLPVPRLGIRFGGFMIKVSYFCKLRIAVGVLQLKYNSYNWWLTHSFNHLLIVSCCTWKTVIHSIISLLTPTITIPVNIPKHWLTVVPYSSQNTHTQKLHFDMVLRHTWVAHTLEWLKCKLQF